MLPRDNVNVRLDLTEGSSQRIKVMIEFNPLLMDSEILFPSWTPGSYKIRDHQKNIYGLLMTQSDKKIELKRESLATWRYQLNENSKVYLDYYVEANDKTVRTSYIDNESASLCLPSIVMMIREHRYSSHKISIKAKPDWQIHIPLKGSNYFLAKDYDELLDTPIHGGEMLIHDFSVKEYMNKLVLIGKPPSGWPTSLVSDTSAICNSVCDLLKESAPSGNRYSVILHMLNSGYGGLEHANSTVLHYSWRELLKEGGYRKLLQLIGHEYLHQWNIKRLTPLEYKQYDYAAAVQTKSLWFVEGVTSYFDITLPYIARITPYKFLLKDFSEEVERLYNSPGRKFHSLSESSEEAWTKLYNSTPSSRNSQISYYNAGAILSLCLDIKLRELGSSLSEILRELWNTFRDKERGYTNNDICKVVKNKDESLSINLEKWVNIPDILPIEECLDLVGLCISREYKNKASSLGIEVKKYAEEIKISNIASNMLVANSGLIPGDEVIAINDYKVTNVSDLDKFIDVSSNNNIIISRDGIIKHYNIEETTNLLNSYQIIDKDNLNESQQKLKNKWLEFC